MNINSMSQLLRRAPRRGAVSGLSRALRFCSGRTAEDILILLGTKSKIDVKEVEEQLNVAATEIRDAIAQLEQEKRVYRYTRHGKWDVLVNTPDSVVNEVLDKQSMASLMKELDALKIGIQGQKASLKDLQVVKDRCDELARKHPNIFATAGMAGMAGLWCLLFWMVFAESAFGCETFAFDWNLVEPITYFLGYSIVWFGVVFYYFTGQEYTYDNVRDLLEAKKRTKLYAQNDFDLEKYLEIQELVSTNEERIAELEELKTCVEPVKVTSA